MESGVEGGYLSDRTNLRLLVASWSDASALAGNGSSVLHARRRPKRISPTSRDCHGLDARHAALGNPLGDQDPAALLVVTVARRGRPI